MKLLKNDVLIRDLQRWKPCNLGEGEFIGRPVGQQAGCYPIEEIEPELLVTEDDDIVPLPELVFSNQSSRVAQTVLEGGSYFLRTKTRFNRVLFSIATKSGSPSIDLAIYQFEDGTSSSLVEKKASISGVVISTVGIYSKALVEGEVVLLPGLIYVLWGKSAGGVGNNFTMRTYDVQSIDIVTTNVPTGLHPVSYTTALPATSTPATFDPTIGGDVSESILDVVPIIRLRKV